MIKIIEDWIKHLIVEAIRPVLTGHREILLEELNSLRLEMRAPQTVTVGPPPSHVRKHPPDPPPMTPEQQLEERKRSLVPGLTKELDGLVDWERLGIR